jgi:RecB family endonuclease NucS
MVEAEPNLTAALETTANLLEQNHPGPIFEATFQHEGVLIRADIISRDEEGRWQLAEVKSSTGPKD